MSAIARWTYRFDATVWSFIPGDGWEVDDSYAKPVHIKCDYRGENKVFINSTGQELTSTMTFSTEFPMAFEDDLILLGIHTDMPPRNAKKVRAIVRSSDIFKSKSASVKQMDDYKIVT